MVHPRLTEEALKCALEKLPGWQLTDHQLVKTFEFYSFKEAMAFVQDVAELAEHQNHHPNIHIYYNRVVLDLMSHDAGGITDRDIQMAQSIAVPSVS